MKRLRALGCILLLATSAGCSRGARTGVLEPSSLASSGERHARVTSETPPPAQMQVGTDLAAGVLRRYCEGKKCDLNPSAAPRPELLAGSDGLLLFILKRVPEAASIQVSKRSNGAVVKRSVLPTKSDTIAYRESLRTGRYVVELVTSWRGHEATWAFALQVPRARA